MFNNNVRTLFWIVICTLFHMFSSIILINRYIIISNQADEDTDQMSNILLVLEVQYQISPGKDIFSDLVMETQDEKLSCFDATYQMHKPAVTPAISKKGR